LSGAIGLATGYDHTCAPTTAGVRCAGSNSYGQLGSGDTIKSTVAVTPKGLSGIVQVAVGRRHGLAVSASGDGSSWGWNDYGQLADGTKTNRPSPGSVTKLGKIVQLAGGYSFSCALRDDGQVWCVGRSNYGQSGTGATKDSTEWQRVNMACKADADCDGADGCQKATCDAGACKWTLKPAAACSARGAGNGPQRKPPVARVRRAMGSPWEERSTA